MKWSSSVFIYCGGTWKVSSCRNSDGCFSDWAPGEERGWAGLLVGRSFVHGASLLFQPFPAPCLCCTTRQGSAAGGAPAGAGQSPPSTVPRPRTLLGPSSRGWMLLCCHREGSWWDPSPGLQSGHGQFLCCGRSVEGGGGNDWKCYPRVAKGEEKDEANVSDNVFCTFFCLWILLTVPVYTIWSTKRRAETKACRYFQKLRHLSVIGIILIAVSSSAQRDLSAFFA